jgi:hypothetical protein
VGAMSFDQFQKSMTVVRDPSRPEDEKLLCYGDYIHQLEEGLDIEETLHIVSRGDGTFYLQIGNMEYISELAELERILYKWALDEYWID